MPITDAAVRQLMGHLEPLRTITSKKMFGGLGIYCDGVFFAVIDNDRLYFKSDAQTDPDYDALDADQWVIEGAEPQPMPYREVPKAILEDPDQLATLIEAAVGVANRKKKPTSRKK